MDILYGDYKDSSTLIEQFYIFGYDPTDKQLASKAIDGYQIDRDDENKNDISPKVINVISAVRDKVIYKVEDILYYLFPYKPKIYINANPQQIPSYDLSVSFTNETTYGVNIDKKFCYALVFYEQYESLCLPKIFCITSIYPFFSLFKKIANKIYSEFEKETISIPIEILIFNLINCLPPPVATPMNLDLSININLMKNRIPNGMHLIREKRYIENGSQQRSNNKVIEYKFPIHEIEKTYYIDYNINFFIQNVNPDILTKLIILTFFEDTLVIFCKDLTFLDNLIQLITLLYAPFIEIQYHLNTYSFPSSDFLSKGQSKVIGKPICSITGYNMEYSNSLPRDSFCGFPAFIFSFTKSKQEIAFNDLTASLQSLYTLIDNSMNQYDNSLKQNKPYSPQNQLEMIVTNVYKRIKSLSEYVRGNPANNIREAFCDSTFNEINNISLQNIAYEYIVDMFNFYIYSSKEFKSNYVNDLIPNEKINITKIKYDIVNNRNSQSPELDIIITDSVFKLGQYEDCFNGKIKEKFKCDMIILDCFMHFKLNAPKEKVDLKCMEIIKEVYDRLKKDKYILYQSTMTFNEFNTYYFNNLESFFKQEMSKSPSIFQPIKYENDDGDEQYIEYSYIHKELDPKIVNKYYRHLKSLSMNDFTKIFPSFNSSQKQKRKINYKMIPIIMQEILSKTITKSYFEEIISLILNVSLLTIDVLCENSPFFYIIYYNDQLPQILLYYYLMDMISITYNNVKFKIQNKSTDIKREMDSLYLALEYMEMKQIIPNKFIMDKLNELFMIESNVSTIIRQKKEVGIKEQYENIFDKKVKVIIKGKKPKEVKEIINGFKVDSSNSTISLLRNDNSVIGEVKVGKVKDLNKITRDIINDLILTERTITMEEKDKLKSIVLKVIAFLYANETIKVDLTSLLDYLG